jgi:type IV pilus assembly protein PilV
MKFRTHGRLARHTQRGVTLIETLVALLVLSIGLLGVAGLQLTSLQHNRGAHMRSQASVLAYAIADRMRANRNVALTGGYNIAFGANPTGATVQALDLQNWKQTITNTLPAGDGSIDLVGANEVRIRLRWTETATDNQGNAVGVQQFETRTRI